MILWKFLQSLVFGKLPAGYQSKLLKTPFHGNSASMPNDHKQDLFIPLPWRGRTSRRSMVDPEVISLKTGGWDGKFA
jgi:hypothetical protein